jgi:hypothetical protein
VELLQVTLVVQVGVDLVEVARVTAGLLLGVDTTDSRHDGGSGEWYSGIGVYIGRRFVCRCT